MLLNGGSIYNVNRARIVEVDMVFLKTQFLAAVSEQCRVWTNRDDAIHASARWLGYRRTAKVIDETARKLILRLLRGWAPGRLHRFHPAVIRLIEKIRDFTADEYKVLLVPSTQWG